MFQFAKQFITRSLLLLVIFFELVYFQFFKCRRIFSFNSFIVFISVINLIILLIDKFITVMYFSARNSVERLQGVYFLINVILIEYYWLTLFTLCFLLGPF